MNVLTINNISKAYGPVLALKNVSFAVPRHTVFGVLGPNGSGKTTLLGILLDVLKSDAGTFQWWQQPDNTARRKIGALLETPNFYHYLSAVDNLKIVAGIKECSESRIDEVLEMTGLLARKHHKFQTYSLGMKQRLAIASALLANPEVLLLDEPTNGLDPAGIAEIRTLIQELHSKGVTIIMASHLLDEVEKVCTHVAILKKGDLLGSGAVDEVLHQQKVVEVSASDITRLSQVMQSFPGVLKLEPNHSALRLYFNDWPDMAALNRFCFEQGVVLEQLQQRKQSLESSFMQLTNN